MRARACSVLVFSLPPTPFYFQHFHGSKFRWYPVYTLTTTFPTLHEVQTPAVNNNDCYPGFFCTVTEKLPYI